jgi:hypothetical protein
MNQTRDVAQEDMAMAGHSQARRPSRPGARNQTRPECPQLVKLIYSEKTIALFAWLISHQSAVLFSQNKPATSNQPAVLFSQNKPAPAISHQPTEQTAYSWEPAKAYLFR